MNERFPDQLAARLAESSVRPAAGSRFQPQPDFWGHYDPPPPQARQAAVLVLLYPNLGQWHVPLTLRPPHLAAHAGQISLPGGAVEPGETSRQAALREFHEELGAEGDKITPLGNLSSLYVADSNFLITPWVAAAHGRPRLSPNPAEVEQLIEVPLAHLREPVNLRSLRRRHRGRTYAAPHFAWQQHRIWGATCMILGELVTVLEGVDL